MSTIPPEPAPARRPAPVPVRTIVAAVASVLLAVGLVELFLRLEHVAIWVAVALFLAAVLHPAVDALVRRVHLRRGIAALVVFVIGAAALIGLGYLFVRPLVDEGNVFVNQFPSYVDDAAAGRGAVGHLVKHYNLDGYVRRNQQNLRNALDRIEKPAVHLARGVLNTAAAAVTIIVVTFLVLLEGPRMMRSGLGALSPPVELATRTLFDDLFRTVSGYVGGLLLRGVLAGGGTYALLWLLGVPFRGVLALWAGFTTAIPVVGALVGAVPAVAVAFIHSTPAGIGVVAALVAYHIIEKRTLGKWLNRRTVALSPLAIVVSVLCGLSLLGILGALLAIPAAGVLQVTVRDLAAFRRPGTEVAPPAGTAPG